MIKVSVVKILPLMEKGMEIRIRMLIDRRVIKNQKWKFLTFIMQKSLKRVKVIEKGQWFKNKSELSWSIQMLSIEHKFRIVVSKSDKKLLVVKCADTSCNCMVRAAKTNPTSEFSG